MDSRRIAPMPSTVREIANILIARGLTTLLTVSVNWVLTFISRRDKLYTRSLRRYDY